MWLVTVALTARAEDPAPAGATTATPVVESLRGTWWFTSQVEGKEAVAWACTGTPKNIAFDGDTFVLSAGGDPIGAAIRATTPKGDRVALATTLEACGGKEMVLRWADEGHHVLEITRCDGAPAVVRAVRDQASGVTVLRQCCEPGGRVTGFVPPETPCRSGDGQKPTPLRR